MSADTKERTQKAIFELPRICMEVLLAIYLVSANWNPCDSTSVASGASLLLIVLGIGLGVLSSADRLLHADRTQTSPLFQFLAFSLSGWFLLSAYQVVGVGNLRTSAVGYWQFLGIAGSVSAIGIIAKSKLKLSAFLRGTIALTVAQSFYALYQYGIALPRMRSEFQSNPLRTLEQLGISAGSSEALLLSNRIQSLEPSGPFALANSLAGSLAVGIILIAFAALSRNLLQNRSIAKSDLARRWTPYVIGFLIVFTLGIALVLTKSRTAWIATVVSLLFLMVAMPTLGRRTIAVLCASWTAMVSIVSIGVASVGLVIWKDPQLITEAVKSLSYRFDYWEGAIRLISSRPIFGFGPLQFQNAYTSVKKIGASESPADPHNAIIEAAFSGGVPFALMLAVIVAILLWRGISEFRLRGTTNASEEMEIAPERASVRPFVFGYILAMIGLFTFSFLTADDDTLNSATIWIIASLVVFYSVNWIWDSNSVHNYRGVIGIGMILLSAVHLSFSGGWLQPGCMIGLSIGIGILTTIEAKPRVGGIASPQNEPVRIRALSFGSWVIMAILFGWSTCISELRLAEWHLQSPLRPAIETPQEGKDAMGIHPWDPEICRQVCSIAIDRALNPRLGESKREEWMETYRTSREELLKRDPSSWGAYQQIGRWESAIAESHLSPIEIKTDSTQLAIEYEKEAAKMFPASLSVQLEAAAICYWNKDRESAINYLKTVSKIDATTPHLDRKLAYASIFVPFELKERILKSDHPAQKELGAGNDGLVRGEPVFRWLRNELGLRE